MYFEHEQFERIDTMKEKPMWEIARDAFDGPPTQSLGSWTDCVNAVIAEHERRNAANFYDQIRPLPVKPEWKLPDPPQGEQWHRTDWTRDMLPNGYRPLLLGEVRQNGDEWSYFGKTWNQFNRCGPAGAVIGERPGYSHHRTTRPLPVRPEWKLPDPPEGEQWHRTDWTRDMLPNGYRPLLLNEKGHAETEYLHPDETWTRSDCYGQETSAGSLHRRTTRPLPVKPDPVLAPLGPDDVPQGAEFRRGKDRLSYSVISESGVTLSLSPDMTFTWADLHHCGWEMRPINGKWQPCAKEVQP